MGDGQVLIEMQGLVDRYGRWTAHNIRLSSDVYTMGPEPSGVEVKLRRVVQVLSDLFAGRFDGVRALDLGCLEGAYALEVAHRGVDVLGIEGREANLEKARFAGRVLGLERAQLVLDDVRNLDVERHGTFDIVLCLGLLYHLDVPDVFKLVERMAAVCTRVLVIDTHVALEPSETRTHEGQTYRGTVFIEHDPNSTQEERAKKLWSSLDNPRSFWLTRPSLLTLLGRAGFTSVFEVHIPTEPEKPSDRVTLVALKGDPELPLLTLDPGDDPAVVAELPPTSSGLHAERPPTPTSLPARLRSSLRRLRA